MRYKTGLIVGILLGMLGAAGAVQTIYKINETEKEFKEGEPNGVVISSEGPITLGFAKKELISVKELGEWVVNAVVADKEGRVYVATSGQGYIYEIGRDGKAQVIYGQKTEDGDQKAEQTQRHVFSLGFDGQGQLLAGAGGEQGQLLRRKASGEFEIIYKEEGLRYIWSIAVGPGGRIYLGTGPEGKIVTLDPDGSNPQVLYKAKEKNILAVALSDEGILYAGGDEFGLVYRIDASTVAVTVAYDTGHGEISGLVFDEKGNLYIATADEQSSRPGQKLILSSEDSSRPEAAGDKGKTADKEEGKPEEKPEQPKEPVQPKEPGNPQEPAKPDEPSQPQKPQEPQPQKPQENKQTNDKTKAAAEAATNDPNSVSSQMPGAQALQAESSKPATPAAAKTQAAGPVAAMGPSGGKSGEGNEIFQLSVRGFVRSIFTGRVMILSLVYLGDNKLAFGTGNQAEVVMLEIETGRAAVLGAMGGVQAPALFAAREGLYVGTANPAGVKLVYPRYEQRGIYESDVLDAEQVSMWGRIQIETQVPSGTKVLVSTRTGNTDDPEKGGWQLWTPAKELGKDMEIASEPGRFLQYRLELTSEGGKVTPTVRQVKIAYMTPNLPPKVTNLEIGGGEEKAGPKKEDAETPNKKMTLSWKGEDGNKDELRYQVYLRPVGDEAPWIRIAKDLKETRLEWNSWTAADGKYEFKVEATDELANPEGQELTASRVSEITVVDNTPPELKQLEYKRGANKELELEMVVEDALSVIGEVEYTINSSETWQIALPKDSIFDSRREDIEVRAKLEGEGPYLLTLRIKDDMANAIYRNLIIE